MKVETRYRYETVPISPEEARRERDSELEHIRKQIDELVKESYALRDAPLPTERLKQIALEPGDPGYEDAPFAFHAVNYQGDFSWIQIPATG